MDRFLYECLILWRSIAIFLPLNWKSSFLKCFLFICLFDFHLLRSFTVFKKYILFIFELKLLHRHNYVSFGKLDLSILPDQKKMSSTFHFWEQSNTFGKSEDLLCSIFSRKYLQISYCTFVLGKILFTASMWNTKCNPSLTF